jgi:AcrR family transcriptional regulator
MTDQGEPQPRRTGHRGERTRARIVEQAARLATIEGLEGLSIGRLAGATGLPRAACTPCSAPKNSSS